MSEPALVYSEVGLKLLEMDEKDKAREIFVLAGNFALREIAPLVTIKEES